jgi:hypothetical protein
VFGTLVLELGAEAKACLEMRRREAARKG